MSTIDPAQIRSPSQIPPAGSNFVGSSAEGLVDVYSGTLSGDVDAQPSAKELLGRALDSRPLSNAEYIYRQVSALYGGADLPDFQSPSGRHVKSVVFVSGSSHGSYGAFHIEGATQADFDRMVVDSLNVSGSYSAGSGLPNAIISSTDKWPHVFRKYAGSSDLLDVFHANDARLKTAKSGAIQEALTIAAQSTLAFQMAFEARNAAAIPQGVASQGVHKTAKRAHEELARRLVQLNQNLLGLVGVTARAVASRQYLSTALFAAEIVESFQTLTRKANPGRTDGEAVSRVLAFKLAPEIALITGFNSAVSQQWWNAGHPDWINDNSQSDQSTEGNGAGVMFLEFLTDYLGIPLDRILQHMPATGGAPLGLTYVALLTDFPQLAQVAGRDGASAFQKMISLLQQNAQNPDGTLNLPADGNPFPGMPGAQHGGLLAGKAAARGFVAQDAQAALGLQAQLEQQSASLKSTLQQIQADVLATAAPRPSVMQDSQLPGGVADLGYRPPLAASLVADLERRAAPYRVPQYDQTLQDKFWKHVYNELPGTGAHTDRLQVITGTIQLPLAVQITGTIRAAKLEPDGDLHIYFQQDDPHFPANQGAGVAPLEVDIMYAGPVTQADAKQAQAGFTNPFDISQLGPGARIQAAGPLVFDRTHGQPASDGQNVNSGLEIHPLVGMTVLTPVSHAAPPAGPVRTAATLPAGGQLSADLLSAVAQAETLAQSLDNLILLVQKMKGEATTD